MLLSGLLIPRVATGRMYDAEKNTDAAEASYFLWKFFHVFVRFALSTPNLPQGSASVTLKAKTISGLCTTCADLKKENCHQLIDQRVVRHKLGCTESDLEFSRKNDKSLIIWWISTFLSV